MNFIIVVLATVFALIAQPVLAQNMYNVNDGSISDWGVTFDANGGKAGYLDTHLPTGQNDIEFVTEDNAASNHSNYNVGPGTSYGNQYDVEAIYFDNDEDFGYIAIVSGVSPTESVFPAGDIFLDTGKFQGNGPVNSLLYEYAIDIQEKKLYKISGDVNNQAGWTKTTLFKEASPWIATHGVTRTYLADVLLNYSTTPVQGHYFLETRFSLADLGISPSAMNSDVWMHWTMKCGNDYLNLHGDVNRAIPEPSSLSLLLAGIGLGWRQFRRKK